MYLNVLINLTSKPAEEYFGGELLLKMALWALHLNKVWIVGERGPETLGRALCFDSIHL